MAILILLFSGPLLYHFADVMNELSIELSYEQLRVAILKIGFIIEVCGHLMGWRVMLPTRPA